MKTENEFLFAIDGVGDIQLCVEAIITEEENESEFWGRPVVESRLSIEIEDVTIIHMNHYTVNELNAIKEWIDASTEEIEGRVLGYYQIHQA